MLGGGPSHIDSYDLKPDAPDEFRGPFRPVATRLAGTRVCELMPLQAGMMNELALLRGIRSVENDHFLSEVYSGLPPEPASGRRSGRSSAGSPAAPPRSPPTSASTGRRPTSSSSRSPTTPAPATPPSAPSALPWKDLQPVKSFDQLRDRKQLLSAFDTMRRNLDRGDALTGLDRFQAKALDMITSPKVRDAFDVSKEPDRVIAAYGQGKYPHQTAKDILYDWNGKAFLLARRLVEAGVRVVTLRAAEWDHHGAARGDIFAALRRLLPLLDRSLFALFSDLKSRGLERDVLVVVLGEFGRTPKIAQPGPGREHWAEAGCAVLFGGGLKMGQVVGETDSRTSAQKRQHQLPEHRGDDLPRAGDRRDDPAGGLQRPAAEPPRRPRADPRTHRLTPLARGGPYQ